MRVLRPRRCRPSHRIEWLRDFGFVGCYGMRSCQQAAYLLDAPPVFLKPEFLLKQLCEVGFRLSGFYQKLVFAVAV